jgi:hypothetical protein
MASARSALNYLLVQAHSMSRTGSPGSTTTAVPKLSTKDAVIHTAYNAGIATMKKKKKKHVKCMKGIRLGGLPASCRADEEGEGGPDPNMDILEGDQPCAATQSDPLAGKIREPLPDENLERAMKW